MPCKSSVEFYMPVSQRYNNFDLHVLEDKKLTSETNDAHDMDRTTMTNPNKKALYIDTERLCR